VVFVDLRGFTGFTETAEPEEVMGVLREYHAELGRAILAYDGTIEHFAGDGAMILFNDPVPVENHELQAIRMALVMRDSVAVLARGWKRRGYGLGFGVGIAAGYATIGTIGFEGRLEYGAIGTVTNLAARLSGEAKDGQILISPRIFSKVEPHIEAEPVGELSLKGFHRPVSSHNVLGIRAEASG
jgi:adenylate cyclase